MCRYRFTTFEDQKWFHTALRKAVEVELAEYVKLYKDEETYFVDFLRDAPEPTGEEEEGAVLEAPKVYEEMPSWEFVIERLFMFMESYNELVRGSKLDMVFFHDAIVHLIRISRVIETPRGSMMLVGVGGSGKQSLTKLASFISGYKNHQIILSR